MQLNQGLYLQQGKYRIDATIGQGGFGITYRGMQRGLERVVTIKEFFMKSACLRDERTQRVEASTAGNVELFECFRRKFKKEAQTIAQLVHPHIIGIYDVFEENNTVYYVMEYVDGGSLQSLVARSGPLPEAQAVAYVRQVGAALAYVHRHKLLHLDVKPDNILLNGAGEAILIDFGVSKHYDEHGGQTSTTPVGISKGYAPIEQYGQEDLSRFTSATEVYSLAATLLFLLSGQRPPEAIYLLEREPDLPPGLSADVRRAILAGMQSAVSRRPRSVADFLLMLPGETDEVTQVRVEKAAPAPSGRPDGRSGKTAAGKKAKAQPAVPTAPASAPPTEPSPAATYAPRQYRFGNNVYEGALNNGLPHGEGRMRWHDKRVYEGQWQHGKMSGRGVMSWPSGKKYTGEWRNGEMHGQGELEYPDGKLYAGGFANGCRHGTGTLMQPNGERFEGEFRNDRITDKGTYYSPSNKSRRGCEDAKEYFVVRMFRSARLWLGDLLMGILLIGCSPFLFCFAMSLLDIDDGFALLGGWACVLLAVCILCMGCVLIYGIFKKRYLNEE